MWRVVVWLKLAPQRAGPVVFTCTGRGAAHQPLAHCRCVWLRAVTLFTVTASGASALLGSVLGCSTLLTLFSQPPATILSTAKTDVNPTGRIDCSVSHAFAHSKTSRQIERACCHFHRFARSRAQAQSSRSLSRSQPLRLPSWAMRLLLG